MKIKTDNGFECEINEDNLDDADLFEKMVAMQKGEMVHAVDVVNGMLGPDGWKNLKTFVKERTGRASLSGVMEEFYAVMKKAPESKKN